MTNKEAKHILELYASLIELGLPDDKVRLFRQAYELALKALEAPKSAGHNCNEDYADCDQFVCSECGIELQDWHRVEREDDGDIIYHEYTFKYCPNCGADMRGCGAEK